MSYDFAKQRQPTTGRPRQNSPRSATRHSEAPPSTHWRWFASGAGCCFLIVAIAYIGMIRLDTGLDEDQSTVRASDDDTPVRPVIDYSFYDELANAEVTVNVDPAPGLTGNASVQRPAAVTNTASPEAETNRFLLQAGSFQQREDAEKRRVEILLMNLEANVMPGVVSGRTWYRVMVGPFNGRISTNEASDILAEQNIETRVLIKPE